MVKCVRLVVTHHQVDSRRLTLQRASDNRWDQHFARRGEAASHPPVHTTSDIPPDTFSAFVFLFQCDSDLCRIIVSSHPQIDPYASAADPSTRRSRAPLGGRSRAGTSWPPRTAPYSRSCNASWRGAWEPSPSRPPAATSTATTA